MASEQTKKPFAIIYTEGKTDWKHLKKAKKKLKIDLPIAFDESEESLGAPNLLQMCEFLSKQEDDKLPGICIFDPDLDKKTLKKVKEENANYKVWKNKFFSFILPIPEHRAEYHENFCIEFYYTDDEITKRDINGRRLFFSNEFKEPLGRHKYNEHFLLGRGQQAKITEKDSEKKIIDSEVFDQYDNNVALSKAVFAENIINDVPPFNNFNFEPFRKVFDIIEEILQKEILPSLQPEPAEEELPPRFFIGREEQFELFEKYLKRNQTISIEGLGGIGKTAFAEKCIERFGLKDRAVWFDCTQDSKFDSLIEKADFADLLKIQNLTERAKYSGFVSLIERHKKVLFLDDFQEVTDSSFAKFFQFLKEYPPQQGQFVLISRERPELRVLTLPIPLEGLEGDTAIAYTQHLLEYNYPDLDIDEQAIESIIRQIKGHPLAIELAIQLLYLGKSPENLLQEIVDHPVDEFLANRLLDEIFNHPKSTQEEKEFMLAFSIFRGKVKEQAFKYLYEGKEVTSIVRRLRRKLMLMHEDGFYETHPLVREFCYVRLSDRQKWHKRAAEYFQLERTKQLDPVLEEKIFYHLSSSEQWQAIVEMICAKGEQFLLAGYADVLKDMMDASIRQGMQSPEFSLFYGDIAEIKCKWDKSLNYYNHALNLSEADEKLQAKALINCGIIFQRKGELQKALSYFNSAYRISQKINYQKGIASSLNSIGLIYFYQGDLKEAIKKYQESLDIYKIVPDKSGIAMVFNNVGRIFYERGELQKAIEYYEESLKIYRETDNKLGFSTYLINIGVILQVQNEWDKAIEKFRESLKINEGVGDISGIATSLNNIGFIFYCQGKLDLALKKYEESLKISEDVEDNSGIAVSLNNIGNVFYAQGDLKNALKNFQKSLKIQKVIGNKLGIATSLNNIGSVFETKGKLDKAFEKYQESLKLAEEIGSKAEIATSLNNIGSVFEKKGEPDKAFEKYQESLKLVEEIGSKAEIATSLNYVGRNLQGKGNLDDAFQKYQASLKLAKEVGSKKAIAASLNNIGGIFHAQGDFQKATENYQESFRLQQEIGSKSGIATGYHNLGSIYFAQKDYRVSLRNLFISQTIQIQIGETSQATQNIIFDIKKTLGFRQFKILSQEVYTQLPDALKPYLHLEKFIEDPTIRYDTPKIGRNDPCPCGSGKKYKKCCGR